MDAIIVAGGVPLPDEPLYPLTQGKPKALLDIEGKPMIQWVLEALNGSQQIEHIVIIGLDRSSGLIADKTLVYVPDQGSMVSNLRAGMLTVREINPETSKILAVSSDIPSITTEMVDWLIKTVLETDDDAYYCVIPRDVMETRYPGSKRSYTHLKDMQVCGGDMNAIDIRLVDTDEEIWERLTAARKNVVKQAALIGFSTLFLLLVRQATISSTVKRVSKRLGLKGRAIVSPYAEMGMDVDKPHQLELVRADLHKRILSGS